VQRERTAKARIGARGTRCRGKPCRLQLQVRTLQGRGPAHDSSARRAKQLQAHALPAEGHARARVHAGARNADAGGGPAAQVGTGPACVVCVRVLLQCGQGAVLVLAEGQLS
jgi:hypothetical protein